MENDKISIAMFGHKCVPSRDGGIEVVVGELAKRMAAKGHAVTLINRADNRMREGNMDDSSEFRNVNIKEAFTVNKKGLAAMTSSVFASIKAALGDYGVVHIHAEGPAFMSWLPKLMGKKVIVTIHGLDWDRAKWGRFATWYIHQGEKNAVRFADSIIVLSQSVKKYFWDKYKRETVFIPNGISKPQLRVANEITGKWGLKKDSYVLYLGRIVPEKGEHYLIEAFKSVRTDKKLVIAGGSSDTDAYMGELKELAKSDDRIIFTGFVQGNILEELYSNCYIYVLPSDLEGMPLSLLEAMSYGNCCVVSDIPECKEVVEDKAGIFSKGNVAELRKLLQKLLDDGVTVAEYKAIAAEYIINKYNWNDVVEKTLELYIS